VDDHPIVRKGLRDLLSFQPDLEVCGETGSYRETWDLIERLKPDVAVVDVDLPDRDGVELTKELVRRYPEIKVLVYSMYDERLYAHRALAAGAKGYLQKREAADRIVEAVRRVMREKIYLSEEMMQTLLSQASGRRRKGRQRDGDSLLDCLSDRELEVLRLIGKGYSRRRIAQSLYISPKTVDVYRDHLKKKLGLSDNAQLVSFAAAPISGRKPGDFSRGRRLEDTR